ncbi:unnamed protein product [Peronospora belbahrii]|uniref:Uncharacterized protein n=1 Tax=Peronospora belbahrii TaxID=622444 RepID=A0AAU9LAF5_9STRA|nr:unnamed protein product [Peronospora belbahrii]
MWSRSFELPTCYAPITQWKMLLHKDRQHLNAATTTLPRAVQTATIRVSNPTIVPAVHFTQPVFMHGSNYCQAT